MADYLSSTFCLLTRPAEQGFGLRHATDESSAWRGVPVSLAWALSCGGIQVIGTRRGRFELVRATNPFLFRFVFGCARSISSARQPVQGEEFW